jgi:hypothetical protein
MAINPSRTVVYLPFVTQTNPMRSVVRAYDETQSGPPIWLNPPAFDEEITQVVPYANGNRLAAISGGDVWLLNADDGSILNPQGLPIHAYGNGTVQYIEPGPNEEIYIMNGTGPVPTELITVGNALYGELVRYQVGDGGLFAVTDQGGALWMRFNGSLARLFSSDCYNSLENSATTCAQ